MQASFLHAGMAAIVVGLLTVAQGANAQVSPDFSECTVTGAGALSCASPTGGTCTLGGIPGHPNAVRCSYSGTVVYCDRDSNGRPTCSWHNGPQAWCYPDNSTERCFLPGSIGNYTSVSPGSVSFRSQTVNVTSSPQYVVFTAANSGYTISGFAVTGDFQIAHQGGSCSGAVIMQSSCTVQLTTTPRLPGARSGVLAMVTTSGTFNVGLTATGAGLAAASFDDKNAGRHGTHRAQIPTPAAIAVTAQLRKKAQFIDDGDWTSLSDSCDPCTGECNTDIFNFDPNVALDPGVFDQVSAPYDPEAMSSQQSSVDPGAPTNPGPAEPGGDQFGVDFGTAPNGDIGSDEPSGSGKMYSYDPINAAAGNKVHLQRDYASRHAGPLSFERTYNSANIGSAALVGQNVGIGWRSNWDRSIVLSTSGTSATVVRGTSKAYTFTLSGSVWSSTSDVALKLARTTDSGGVPIGWQLTLPNGTVEIYDALGRFASMTTRKGLTYQLAYDASNRLQSVSNGFGRQIRFAYDTASRLSTMTDPAGGVTTYTYDSLGRATQARYPDNRTRGYRYESSQWPFALTGINDGTGANYATFTYDNTSGNALSSQFAGNVGGGTISYPSSNHSTLVDASGARWDKTFVNNMGELRPSTETVTCTNCPTAPLQLGYDSIGQLSSYTNRLGIQTTYVYNSRGLPTTITEAAGKPEQRVTTITWHATFNLPTQITRAGQTISYQYDANGRTTQKAITAGSLTRTWQYSYNALGLITQVVGPRTDVNDVVTYAYDAAGNLTSATNQLGQATQYSSYNALGQPQQIQYANGTIRNRTYDARGRILTDSYAGNTATNTYDANGKLTSTSNSDGSSTTYLYDAAQRLTGINNNHNEQVRYTLDAAGHTTLTDVFDGGGALVQTSSATYDGLGRIKRQIDANGNATSYVYDAKGNVTKITDPLSNVTQYAYDGLNRRILVTDPLNKTTGLIYDLADRLTQLADPNNNATGYTFNGLGDNTQLSSPDTGSTSYTFDSAGNTLTQVDARGKTTTYSYDALGRITHIMYADGQGVTKTYDVAANGVGQLASMTDLSGITSFTYDANGRIASKTQTVAGVSLTVSYGRDSLGRVSSVTYPSGKVVGQTYANDRLASLTWNGVTLLSGIQYFPFGGPESWLFGGTTEYTRYTDANKRTSGYLTPSGTRAITRDAAGRITQIADSPTHAQNFTYDAKGRLLTFAGFTSAAASETRAYTYDNNDNRLTANVNGVQSTYSYQAGSNRLLSVSALYGNSYDAAGNLTADGQRIYSYDARGRMIQVAPASSPTNTTTFNYNAFGQAVVRVGTDQSGQPTTTIWMYDEAGHMIGEYVAPDGAPVQEFAWLGSTMVGVAGSIPTSCQTPPCTVYGIGYVWTDQLDTPRAITNASNAIVWQWDSAPFGDTSPNSNPSSLGVFALNHRLPGQYYDATGTIQNGARFYDPIIGRYVQSDPTGLQAGPNTFGYANANPLRAVDPTGLDSDSCQAPTLPPDFVGEICPLSRVYVTACEYRCPSGQVILLLKSPFTPCPPVQIK